MLNAQQEHLAAESSAREGLQLDASHPETWYNLGSALAGQQRWPEAAAAFDSAFQNQAGWLVALTAAGQAYRSAGQLQGKRSANPS